MLLPPAPTTRRTAVGGTLAAVVLTACDLQELDPRSEPASAPTTSVPPVDADTTLVNDVLAELGPALYLVRAVRRRHDSLRGRLAPLDDLHEAYVAVLGGRVAAAVPQPPPDSRRAFELVRRGEQRLQRRLVAAAVAAESGQLAKLLASMSAGLAQHLAALDVLDLQAQP